MSVYDRLNKPGTVAPVGPTPQVAGSTQKAEQKAAAANGGVYGRLNGTAPASVAPTPDPAKPGFLSRFLPVVKDAAEYVAKGAVQGLKDNFLPFNRFDKAAEAGMQPILDKTINTEAGRKVTSFIADNTSNIPLKAMAAVEALRPDITYREAFRSLKATADTAQKTGGLPAKVSNAVLNSGPQSAIGVALSFIPYAGKPLSYAYWAAISADEQIKTKGKVESIGDIGIDVVGDSMLGSALTKMLGTGSNVIIQSLKSAGIEGTTEVAQTILKLANDWRNAPTPELKASILANAKEYITSEQAAIEFLAGVGAGAGISAATSIIGQQTQNEKNDAAKSPIGVYNRLMSTTPNQDQPATAIPVTDKVAAPITPAAPTIEPPAEVAPMPQAQVSKPVLNPDSVIPPAQADVQNTSAAPILNPASRRISPQPVKTEGVEVKSAAFQRVTDRLGNATIDEPTYNRMNLAEDSARALKFVENNTSQSRQVALGIIPPPTGVTETAVSIAYAEAAREKGDWQGYAEAERSRSLRQTRRGQEIAAENGRANENSPSHFLQKVIKARMEMAGRPVFGISSPFKGRGQSDSKASIATNRMRERTVALKDQVLNKASLSVQEAQSILDQFIC